MGKTATPASAESPATEFTDCPNWGKGGRYIVGADGKRVRQGASSAAPAAAAEPQTTSQPATKGK